ncbi:MAG: choline kinase family protein [Clostridium sp.]
MKNIFKYKELTPLGGLSNSNYLLNYYNTKYVLRIPNNHDIIDFSIEHEILELIKETTISPQIIYHNETSGILLSRFLDNSSINEHTPNNTVFLGQLSTTLKKLHSLSCSHIFNPFHEIRNNIEYLKDINFNLPKELWTALNKLNKLEPLLNKDITYGLCHNDLNPSNVLFKDNKVYLIDFEYTAMGDIFYDIATFCWLLNEECRIEFLKSYFGYYSDELHTKLENYLFVVKLWNATWSYKKSLTSLSNYDYSLGAKLILEDIIK